MTKQTQSRLPRRSSVPDSLAEFNVPSRHRAGTPIQYAEVLGEAYLAATDQDSRRNGGHYLTPAKIARFMASKALSSKTSLRVLDPGSGTGILSAAICEMSAAASFKGSIHIDAYETDPDLATLSELALRFCQEWLHSREIAMTFNVRQEDFVLAHADSLGTEARATHPLLRLEQARDLYDIAVSNPPYFKIAKDDPRAMAASLVVHGQPNIYALFMAISSELLA